MLWDRKTDVPCLLGCVCLSVPCLNVSALFFLAEAPRPHLHPPHQTKTPPRTAAPVSCLPLPPDIRCRSRTATSMPPPTPRLSIPGASKAAKESHRPPPFTAAAPRGRSPPTPERRPSSLEPRRGLGSSPQGISCLPQASPSGCLPGLAVRWVPPASPRSLWRSARCRRSGAAASTASPRASGGGRTAGEKLSGPSHGPGPLGPV